MTKQLLSLIVITSLSAFLSGCSGGKEAAQQQSPAPESATGTKGTMSGIIGDSMCGTEHAGMIKTGSMGDSNATCTIKCVEAGSHYVLVNEKGDRYTLSNDEQSKKFAGQKVEVTGSIDEARHRINVESIK